MRKTLDISRLTLFKDGLVLQPKLVPLEVNLEGWPLFSRKKTRTDSAMEVRESISTSDGRRLEQVWRVTASHDFSLPGTFDEDIFVGVMALVSIEGECRPTARYASHYTNSSRYSVRANVVGCTRKSANLWTVLVLQSTTLRTLST